MRHLLRWFLILFGEGNLAQRPKASTDSSEDDRLSYPDVWFDSEHDYIPKPPPPLPKTKRGRPLKSRLWWEQWNAGAVAKEPGTGASTDDWAGIRHNGPLWYTVHLSGQAATPRFGHTHRWGG